MPKNSSLRVRRAPAFASLSARGSLGFTLVELLAVIAILGLLFALAVPLATKAQEKANVTACKSNLRQISGLVKTTVETRKNDKWNASIGVGVKLLLLPYKLDEVSGKNLEIYVCPGTSDTTWYDEATEGEYGAGFEDWDNIELDCISYAGRDTKQFKLDKNKLSEEVLAADDNDGRANHPNITNVVYADSSVGQVDLADFEFELQEDADWVPVGPESPDEELQKLLIDF